MNGFKVYGSAFVTGPDKWPLVAVNAKQRFFTFATLSSLVNKDYKEATVAQIFEALETPPPVTEIECLELNAWASVRFYSDGSMRIENRSKGGLGLTLSRNEVRQAIMRYEILNP